MIKETWVIGDLYTYMRLYLLHTYLLYLYVLMLSLYTIYYSSVSVNITLLRILISCRCIDIY